MLLLIKKNCLTLSDYCLSHLPSGIGLLSHLTFLYLSSNQLTSVPIEIGNLTNLQKLDLYSNKLTSVPIEIGNLTNLQKLDLHSNKLTSVPTEIGNLNSLAHLFLHQNRKLSELPMGLGNIRSLTYIDIDDTQIDQQFVARILKQCQTLRQQEFTKYLPILLSKWLCLGEKSYDLSFIKDWQPSEATILYEWLVRLERAKDFQNNQKALASIVIEMLKDFSDPDFKNTFIAQASQNNERCGDRAAMALNELYLSWHLFQLSENPKATDQEKLSLMIRAAKTSSLRKAVSIKISAREKDNNTTLNESVEIYLYVEQTLRKPMNLLTATQGMYYQEIGKVSWINLDSLRDEVENNYLKELVDIQAIENVLEDILMKNETYNKAKVHLTKHSYEQLEKLGKRPPGEEYAENILQWKASQGEIMRAREEKIKELKVQYIKSITV